MPGIWPGVTPFASQLHYMSFRQLHGRLLSFSKLSAPYLAHQKGTRLTRQIIEYFVFCCAFLWQYPYSMSQGEQNGCVIIPAYLEEKRIRAVVQNVRQYIDHIMVVDDGSPDKTSAEASAAGAIVLRHEKNLGKGTALNTGFAYAAKNNFDFIITLDADGQHDPADIPAFVAAYRQSGAAALVGNRMADPQGMPFIRRLTNRFMSWYLSRQMGQYVPDTQCGYRLYSVSVLPCLATEASRYAAESETLLRLAAHKVKIGHVPIRVIYRGEKSKIRPLGDTLRFFAMIRRFRKGRKLAA
jgi:glycosyltransferase involved in cell wall biosynthesis